MTSQMVVSNPIERMKQWFTSHCDGEWEHQNGVIIQTTDNPGWWVKIDLRGTELLGRSFEEVQRGELSLDPQPPWLRCYREGDVFNGAGDPTTLEEILNIFLDWASRQSADEL